MNKIGPWALLLLICFYASCSSAQNKHADKKQQVGYFLRQKQIVWKKSSGDYYVKIEEGDQLVFELNSISGSNPRNDTQIKSTLIFSINPNLKAFDFEENLTTACHAFFLRNCRCVDAGYNKLISGKITGKFQEDGTWALEVDVKSIGNDSSELYHFAFSGSAREQK